MHTPSISATFNSTRGQKQVWFEPYIGEWSRTEYNS